jgi:glycosyltransferase involved in cell wall biosynthesis
MEGASQEVSIVITAFNNADTFPDCFSSLAAQTYPFKEIVVVCDRSSSDETEKVVDSVVRSFEHSRVVKCNNVGRSRARNIGWQSVSSPIVMFADGDDVYEKTYVEKAAGVLQNEPAVGGVCLGGKALTEDCSILSRYYEAYGATDARVGDRSGSEPDWAWVYRRDCIAQVKGFDEGLAQAEDKDLCARVKKAGYRIAYVGGTNWYRRKPERVSIFLKKEYLGGKRRVVYELRNNEYRSLLMNVVPAVFLIIVLVSTPVLGALYSLLVLLTGLSAYGLFSVERLSGRGFGGEVFWFLGLGISGRLASSVGSLYGLFILGLRRVKVVRVDLGRF